MTTSHRFEIPVGQELAIDELAFADALLQVETGSAHVVAGATHAPLGAQPTRHRGPIRLRNSGDVPAIVLATPAAAAAPAAVGIGAGQARFSVICMDEPPDQRLLASDRSAPEADEIAFDHNQTFPGHNARRQREME